MKRLTLLLLTLVMSIGLFAQENLAQNKTTAASSVSAENSTFVAANAVDGDTGTKWASDYTSSTDLTDDQKNAQWFYIDLGSVQSVNVVKILWDNQAAKKFAIRYSDTAPVDDNSVKTTGTEILNNLSGTDNTQNTYAFPSVVSARYIIIDFQERTSYGYGMYEIEVYNIPVELSTIKTSRSFAQTNDVITFTAYDQFSRTIAASEVTYTINGTAQSKGVNTYTVLAEDVGTINVSAVTDGDAKTTLFYVITDNDAPRIPTDIHIPFYSNGDESMNSTFSFAGMGYGTVDRSEIQQLTLKNLSVLNVPSCGKFTLGNTKAPFTEAVIDFNPATNNVKEFKFDIFVPGTGTATGTLDCEEGNTFDFEVTKGSWQTVAIDVSGKSNLHILFLEMTDAPDILLTNIYFTSATADRGDLRFRTFNIEPGSTKATLILKADYENEESRDVHFIITRKDNGEFVKYVSGKTNKDLTCEITSYNGSALTPDQTYGWLVATAYEVGGTQPETVKTREVYLKTIPVALKDIEILNNIISKQVYPKSATKQTSAEWNRTEGDGGQNYRIVNTDDAATEPNSVVFSKESDPNDIIESFNTTNGQATIKANAVGVATFKVTATNGTPGNAGYSTVSKTFTINVYETTLTATFKVGETTYSSKSSDVSLAQIFANNSVAAKAVTELKIESGNLSAADILTIRGMAGIKNPTLADGTYNNIFDNTATKIEDYRSQNAAYGSLTTLDLTGATFASSSGTLVSLPTARDASGNVTEWYPWLDYCNLNDIPHYAFMGCYNLTKVVLPTNVENIGEYAFQYCDNLVTVENTDKVKEFGGYCFMHDANLASVTIGESCTSIGYSAFQNCRAMTLTNEGGKLPSSLEYIGTYAFASTGITQIVYPANAPIHMHTGVFYDCKSLVTAYLPSNLKTIGYQAFQGDDAMTTLTFYDENSTFTAGVPATTGNTYNNVLNVVAAAFQGCTVLSDESFQGFTIAGNNGGKTVMMGWTAFSDCEKMTATTAQALLDNFVDGSDEKGADDNTVLRNGEGGNDDYALPHNLFSGCTGITANLNIPDGIVSIGSECFKATNAPQITVGKDVATLGDRAFEDCTNTTRITFNSATAPACTQVLQEVTGQDPVTGDDIIVVYDPFNRVEPNNITIAFGGSADYTTYRASVPFMRQMTKTVNAESTSLTEYTIAPQFGGDFKMTRSFTQGWNTLALPFGSEAAGKTVNGVAKYKAAFGEENFDHISTYRGVKESTFMFMKMDDGDAMPDFEPVMVKLNNAVTTEITFSDVDINYNHSTNTLIDASSMKTTNVSLPSDDYSSVGQLAGLSGDFDFTGTYKVLLNASADDMTYIKDGDYIIQTNDGVTNFVKCETGKRYGLKAFRGWFKKKDGGSAKPLVMSIMDFSAEDAILDEIGTIDLSTGEITTTPQDIYSINGQLVRKGATSVNGLSKGLYIMGGRKIVVK